MAHLSVYLYDRIKNGRPSRKIHQRSITDGSRFHRLKFHNLNNYNAADKAAAVKIYTANEYRRGDHILLLDRSRGSVSDTIAIDPDIRSVVDLNNVIFNNHGFADRAAALKFVTNPHADGSYRLRVRLFDKESPTRSQQRYPTLIFYDWQVQAENPIIRLHDFNFDDKTAFVIVDKGSGYRKGDRIILHDHAGKHSHKLILEPDSWKSSMTFNLNAPGYVFADKAAFLEFALVPDAHVIVKLYDRLTDNDKKPMCILNDYNPQNPKRPNLLHNLNDRNAADKAAKVIVEPGSKYRCGDHIRLFNEVGKHSTDTVSIDPNVNDKVDLHQVIFNDKGFDDRAAGIQVVRNPNADGSFRLRLRLYDKQPGNASYHQKHPTLVLYDWEFPPSNPEVDLNAFHLADKISTIILDKGPDYREGDHITLYDNRGSTGAIRTLEGPSPEDVSKVYHLNRIGFADKTAVIKFGFGVPTSGKKPEKVELYEAGVKKLVLRHSNLGSLNDMPGESGVRYEGRATSAKIYGPAGSVVIFFDDQAYGLSQNAVRIKKFVDTPIFVSLATNFINSDEEAGDGIYLGISPNEEYEWMLFKNVKRDWFQRTFPNFDQFLQEAKEVFEESEWEDAHWVVDGIGVFQATGIGRSTSNNYRVDNCSSVYFDSDE